MLLPDAQALYDRLAEFQKDGTFERFTTIGPGKNEISQDHIFTDRALVARLYDRVSADVLLLHMARILATSRKLGKGVVEPVQRDVKDLLLIERG